MDNIAKNRGEVQRNIDKPVDWMYSSLVKLSSLIIKQLYALTRRKRSL